MRFLKTKFLLCGRRQPMLRRQHLPRARSTAYSKNSLASQLTTSSLQCALPSKQCASDPLPTSLLTGNVVTLAPFLVELFNRCLTDGVVQMNFKSAYITPLLKKTDLDASDPKSYRPISNLSILSKLQERVVARQLKNHLQRSGLMPHLQSAYPHLHSTEIAVRKVLSDILRAAATLRHWLLNRSVVG